MEVRAIATARIGLKTRFDRSILIIALGVALWVLREKATQLSSSFLSNRRGVA
jgi:hypothetical protein